MLLRDYIVLGTFFNAYILHNILKLYFYKFQLFKEFLLSKFRHNTKYNGTGT
jgi:hypothetical protein